MSKNVYNVHTIIYKPQMDNLDEYYCTCFKDFMHAYKSLRVCVLLVQEVDQC